MRPRHQITVRPGQWVRVCFHAKRTDEVGAPPLVPARLSKPLRVFAVNSNAVRIGGDTMSQGSWHKSWVRCAKPVRGKSWIETTGGKPYPGTPESGVPYVPGLPKIWVLDGTGFT